MTQKMMTDEDQAVHSNIGTWVTGVTPRQGRGTGIQLTMAERVVEISQEGQDKDMMGMIRGGIKNEDMGLIIELTVTRIRIITEDHQVGGWIHQIVNQRSETGE